MVVLGRPGTILTSGGRPTRFSKTQGRSRAVAGVNDSLSLTRHLRGSIPYQTGTVRRCQQQIGPPRLPMGMIVNKIDLQAQRSPLEQTTWRSKLNRTLDGGVRAAHRSCQHNDRNQSDRAPNSWQFGNKSTETLTRGAREP